MVEVKFNLGKRDFVWIGIIVVLLGLGFGYAYVADGSGDPAVMGHSVGELESINWSQINNRPTGLDNGDDDTIGTWPSGSYCVMKNGGSCPAGFAQDQLKGVWGSHRHDQCGGEAAAGSSTCNVIPGGADRVQTMNLIFCCK